MATLRLQFLQSPALSPDDGEARPLPPLDAALLAYLAIHGPTPRATLAQLLWPQRTQAQALTNLRQRLHHLRRVAPGLIAPGSGALALGADLQHDLQDPQHALVADADALAGPLLGHDDYAATPELAAWVNRERAHWTARLRDQVAERATALDREGRIAHAISYAKRLVREDAAWEHGVRLLMRLHHRRGDKGAALAVYEDCVRALHEQFGDPVSEETAALAQAVAQPGAGAPAPVAPMPLSLRHPPRLVGRDAVLETAQRLWDGAGVVLLAGPAGIGKTRVFDELCQRWRLTRVLRLTADDPDRSLGLLRGLLALTGAAPEHLEPGVRVTPASLAAGLARQMAELAARAPLAIGVEDLHFADAESLQALMPLVRPGGPVRWLFSSRLQPLPQAVDGWLQRHDEVAEPMLELADLGVGDLADFVATLGDGAMLADAWAAALHGHCGGNPLNVLQVLRATHDQGSFGRRAPPATLPQPSEVRLRVARRLDGSDALTQQLAFIASLAGADFDADLARRVTGCSAAELTVPWRRLEGLGILRGDRFSHELVRQAVLQSVPAPLQPALHGEIAHALAGRGNGFERRGTHWEAAARPREAGQDFVRAADEALQLGLPLKARALLRRADGLFAAAGDAAAAFDMRWRGGRLALAWESAGTALEVARALQQDAADDRQRAMACCLQSQAMAEQHDAAALDAAERALDWARRAGDAQVLVQARLRRAMALNIVGRWDEALAQLDELARETRETRATLALDDANELADTRMLVLAALGRRQESVDHSLAARDRALASGQLQRAAELASAAAVQLGYLCRTQEEIESCEQSIALCRRLGAERGSVFVDTMTLAGAYADVGRFADALPLAEQAADGLREAGLTGWVVNADNSLAAIFMLLGRLDLAAQRLAQLPPKAPLWARAARELMHGKLLHRRTGQSPLPHLQRAFALFEQSGALLNPYTQHRIDVERVAWCPAAQALDSLATAETWSREQEHVSLLRVVLKTRVEVLLKAGRSAEAAAEADALEAEFAGVWVASNFYLPELWQKLVQAWDAGGQKQRADAMAQRALHWLDERERDDVPPLFIETFRSGNAVNRWFRQRQAAPSHR